MSPDPKSRLRMPGFNVPLEIQPQPNKFVRPEWEETLPPILGFVRAVDPIQIYNRPFTEDLTLTLTEIMMIRAINFITEKPKWDSEAFDPKITSMWRDELLQNNLNLSPKMMECVIQELQQKTELYRETGLVECFDKSIMKSSVVIPEDVQRALQRALAPLETASGQKDYEPGYNNQVVNLVDPSLFPVVFGRTRVLPDKVLSLDGFLERVGEGVPLPITAENSNFSRIATINDEIIQAPESHTDTAGRLTLSTEFQWLPFDLELGGPRGCRILSYINNVHPIKDRALYTALEDVIGRIIPSWEQSLLLSSGEPRVLYDKVEYDEQPTPEPKQPEPRDFIPRSSSDYFEPTLNLAEKFSDQPVQVILKAFNIELTPDKPHYEGSPWYFGGQLNERICSTAMYFYNNENVTENNLTFRTRSKLDYINYGLVNEKSQYDFLQKVFGFGPEVRAWGPSQQLTQELGSISCKEGQIITFPPTVQHQIAPFSLVDKSKPGHCKVLVLYLVDPHRRIISSANVPPQREDWSQEKTELVESMLAKRLPLELEDMITKDAYGSPMTMDEARKYRLALLEEHDLQRRQHNSVYESGTLSLHTPRLLEYFPA